MISSSKKIGIWISYIIFSPLIFYIIYLNSAPIPNLISLDYAIFLGLSILVALYPIRTEDSILFLINGVSLSVFVLFGLLAELIITSLALFILLIRSSIKSDEHYRYPLNLLIFQFQSIVAGLFYLFFEQYFRTELSYTTSMILLIVYMFVHLIANHLATFVVNRYYYGDKDTKFITNHLNFSIYTSLFIVPVSFILIYLTNELGTIGALIGALPFITITLGINFYYKTKMNNTYLKNVNILAQDLTEKKKRIEVIETYLGSLAKIFPVDAYSYFTVSQTDELHRVALYEKKKGIKTMKEKFVISEQSILHNILEFKEMLYYSRATDWKHHFKFDISYPAESALVLPVMKHEKVSGLILISHTSKNIYNEMMVSLIKILHQYFIIALENASQYELLEENSEKDYLTELPNLKAFSKDLEMALKEENDCLSLIVLDLDRFKNTNDTYGHQAGNEVLKQVASLLVGFVKQSISVYRYGGEEFLVLLPHYSKKDAGEFAEHMRSKIEQNSFVINQSILDKKKTTVSVTASMGVSTYPEDSREADELITLADKAMYIGSKQRGRNRVTIARKGSYENEVEKIL